jgi:ATP-dependent DNA helicase RecG
LDDATSADLNPLLIRTVADQLSPGMSMEKCLQYLDLAEYIGPGVRLRRAALLLFAKEPNRWHPRLQIRIIKVAGTELRSRAEYNAKSDQTVTGNLLELIERGWDSLRPQLVQTRLGRGARFESTMMYPELACREALVNALAHRDFSEEGRGIEIFVFDDRMQVKNPGSLLSSVSIGHLLRLEECTSHEMRSHVEY